MIKFLHRRFTLKEIIIIIALVLILCGLSYYQFVDRPVRHALQEIAEQREKAETDLEETELQAMSLAKMKKELQKLEGDRELVSYMPSYNYSKEELGLLNDILFDTDDYTVSFNEVTRKGKQIRRSFTLSFQAESFRKAEKVLRQLEDGKIRCLLGDISCVPVEKSLKKGAVNINTSGTFYETMYGGKEDGELPKDSSDAREEEEND